MQGILKGGNLVLRHHHFENVPLTHDSCTRLLYQLGLVAFCLVVARFRRLGFGRRLQLGLHLGTDFGIFLWKFGRTAILRNLGFQLVGSLRIEIG